ncbi:MAG TPA: hypothetical protein PLX89_03840 [Verrucomicrobiota bacterium]|nr:hypothetical protein [Verrucomicrobiales bacterium]HRI12115.1 hypothetical protein [Verrucomicrobiota bacterium]
MRNRSRDLPEEKEIVRATALEEYLRLKVRYFNDGAVLGTRAFVNEVFAALRERFSPKRREAARPMVGLKNEVFTLRELRARVFGVEPEVGTDQEVIS